MLFFAFGRSGCALLRAPPPAPVAPPASTPPPFVVSFSTRGSVLDLIAAVAAVFAVIAGVLIAVNAGKLVPKWRFNGVERCFPPFHTTSFALTVGLTAVALCFVLCSVWVVISLRSNKFKAVAKYYAFFLRQQLIFLLLTLAYMFGSVTIGEAQLGPWTIALFPLVDFFLVLCRARLASRVAFRILMLGLLIDAVVKYCEKVMNGHICDSSDTSGQPRQRRSVVLAVVLKPITTGVVTGWLSQWVAIMARKAKNIKLPAVPWTATAAEANIVEDVEEGSRVRGRLTEATMMTKE